MVKTAFFGGVESGHEPYKALVATKLIRPICRAGFVVTVHRGLG